jgi:SAM-dependent methyltransferase
VVVEGRFAEGERDNATVAYYNQNVGRFADTGSLDMSALYERFLGHVPQGGRILDAGCGVGRDALAFAERGYSVVAFDASAEMVRLAIERTAGRVEVLRMGFDDVGWLEEFDGVWACASLLHVRATDLPPVLRRLQAALRPGGTLHMSFKYGSDERVVGGRRFTDHTEQTLPPALGRTGLELAEVWVTGDVRAGRTDERWLNALARRAKR